MDDEVRERREDARFAPPPRIEVRATLRPGCLVLLIDVSARGALVQAARPLRPGARVHLQVQTPTRRLLTVGTILRCMVWSLVGDDGVIYRGAMRFDHPVEWAWADATRRVHAVPVHGEPRGTNDGNRIPASHVPSRAVRREG